MGFGVRRGLSTIVSTLLILLLVFVAVSLLWVVVRNVIQSGTEQVSLGKLTLDFEIESVVISGTNLNVRVKRNSGEGTFTGLSFILSDGDASEVIEINNLTMNEYVSRTFTISPQKVLTSNLQTVEVAPIFTLESGKQVTGDVKDSYIFSVSGAAVVSDSCGDNIIDSGESCDGTNISLTDTCLTAGYNGGTLACSSDCSFDYSACTSNCPDGVIDSGEQCDCGSDGICTSLELNTQTCASYLAEGWSGTLGCSQTSCQFDTSGCVHTAICGDGINETGEQCDDGNTNYGDGCSNVCVIEENYVCTGGSGQSTCTTNVCGDGILQGIVGEVCDCGSDGICTLSELAYKTCITASTGYSGGTLGCNMDTCQFDFSACTASSSDWPSGIIAWLNFDEGANDSIRNNDAYVIGPTHVTSGCAYGAGCYSFDGVNDYMFINATWGPWSSLLDLDGSAVSVSGLFNPTSIGSTQVLLGKPSSSTSNIEPFFSYGVRLLDNNIQGYVSTSASSTGLVTSGGTVLSPNQWYHFILVYDDGQLCIYLDGTIYGACSSVASGSTLVSYDTPFRIGTNGGLTENFGGLMDEIIVWNRALNSTEISGVFTYFS